MIIDKRKLVEFITGELPVGERAEILDWIESSDKNQQEYSRIKNTLALSHLGSSKKTEETILRRRARTISGTSHGKFLKIALKYAAAIIISAGVASTFFIVNSQRIQSKLGATMQFVTSPPGQTTEIILADGSIVSLNSGTTLKYAANYDVAARNLWLEGEAYFDVIANNEKPFVVYAGNISITATGTSFNVNAYTEDHEINVTLIEGGVILKNATGIPITTLSSGQNAEVDVINGWFTKKEVDTRFYTSWQKGIITFSNKQLGDIAKDLERWYNVEIVFDHDSSKDIRYSGTILKNKPIDQVLEILKLTSHFDYNIKIDNERKSIIKIKEKAYDINLR